ncbi:hypothetical protein J6590_028527 [Homalodisca vitripennis]|nr:hypothetical protein J6590_028527 [Homalodisca vitripennis]
MMRRLCYATMVGVFLTNRSIEVVFSQFHESVALAEPCLRSVGKPNIARNAPGAGNVPPRWQHCGRLQIGDPRRRPLR